MDILKKLLLFLVCMVFAGNVLAMEEYDEYYKKKYGFIESQLKPKEKIAGVKNLTFNNFLAKKDKQSIVYNTLCKDRNNMPPFLSIVKFPIVSEDSPTEITHVYYIVDPKPFEEQAIKEKIEEIGRVQLENARFLDDETKKLHEKEKIFTEKEQLLNTREQELIKKEENFQNDSIALDQRSNDITKREEALQKNITRTFWRSNPWALGITSFLAGGLLFGTGAYYGQAKIDAFVGYLASFWRKDQ